MEHKNQKEAAPLAHYLARFSQLDPREAVQRRAGQWDGSEFYVNLLGREYRISHPAGEIQTLDGGKPLPARTFLLRYLLEGRALPWQGRWKTFRELPWGEMYGQVYQGRILGRAARSFGSRLEEFRAAAQQLGGEPVPHGDAGYCFRLIGDYRMQLILWAGDGEFPASAQILYSDNFAAGFTAEDRVVAAELLLDAVKNVM